MSKHRFIPLQEEFRVAETKEEKLHDRFFKAERIVSGIISSGIGDAGAQLKRVALDENGLSFDLAEDFEIAANVVRGIIEDVNIFTEEFLGIELARSWSVEPWVCDEAGAIQDYNECRAVYFVKKFEPVKN